MIIKKNQTKISKNPSVPKNVSDESQKVSDEQIQDEELNQEIQEVTLEQIAFEQREERREGSRRRGYRRTSDRMILTRAQEEAANIKNEAYKEGYQKGIEAATAQLNNLNNAVKEYCSYKATVVDAISESVYDIALDIAQKILKKQIDTDSSAMINMIKDILNDINRHETRITLKVRAEDVEAIKSHFNELFPEGLFDAKISILPDKSITEGGVVLETSNGIVDARISTQLEILKNAFKS